MSSGESIRALRATILTLAAVCCLPGPFLVAGPAVVYGSNPEAGRYYDLRGFRMYTETYGSGRPLLMIHGNGGSMSAFAANVPYFAQRYQVILADSRSQGKSLDPDHPITFEMMADDFAALLDAMHIPAAYVIGWSDGGINALLLAIRHPGKVVALAASGANLWPGSAAFGSAAWEDMEKQRRETRPGAFKTDKERNDWKLFLLDYAEPHISPDDLRLVRCPALIICGDHDMITIDHTVLIYRSIPRANLWVVPDSGHATLMEHSAEFDGKVDAFFTAPFHDRKG
jgi:pimeloyl-ACP methyl ester carboxylesterase